MIHWISCHPAELVIVQVCFEPIHAVLVFGILFVGMFRVETPRGRGTGILGIDENGWDLHREGISTKERFRIMNHPQVEPCSPHLVRFQAND
jgi:hypothetical protein